MRFSSFSSLSSSSTPSSSSSSASSWSSSSLLPQPSSSTSQLQSTLLLSYSLSGKLHPIEENPFEELYEQSQHDHLAEDDQDTSSYSDSESDSEESSASSFVSSHSGRRAYYPTKIPQATLSTTSTVPRPKALLLHAAHSQQHAQSPPSSWRFPRTSPSQNYALSVLRYAYALSSLRQKNMGEAVGRDVIWSSGTRWY